MSRPLRNVSDLALREDRIRLSAELDSFDETVHYFEKHLDMHDTAYLSRYPQKTRDMFAQRDYGKLLKDASEVARGRLDERLKEVLDEIEQRELDAIDARDPTGGIAA